MPRIDVIIDVSKAQSLMKRLVPLLDKHVDTALRISARQISDTARQLLDQRAKNPTPVLVNTIMPGTVEGRFSAGDATIRIVAGGGTVNYAKFVEDDTAPHDIPKAGSSGKVLRFNLGGRVVYRRSVRHPGTKGIHYMKDSLESNADFIADQFEQAAELAVAEASA